ncbi:CPBP family intramembrane metalloprotease [Chloroflexi bacterium TSY]|nr:CPBP family intramembrane metalloprotease [Chloroflexi bacterium TSY]
MNKYDKTTPVLFKNPWFYFAVTFAWTWAFWGAAILLKISLETPLGLALFLTGALGTLVTGIGFTYLTKNKEGQHDYWRRMIDVRRVGLKWFLTLLLFVPVLNGLAALIDYLLGGPGAVWGNSLVNIAANPFGLVLSALFATLVPFIEEVGWRGYVLDRLQSTRSALMSSLILGIVWSLWHLPLFFAEGTYQASLGIGTVDFWMFLIGVVPLSFAFTWVYNNTNRSILAVILFHSMVNFTGELFDIVGRANTISIVLWVIAAVGIMLLWGPKTFTREPMQDVIYPSIEGAAHPPM